MGKKCELGVELRASIVTLRKEGYSHAKISMKLKIPKSTVQYTLKRFEQSGQNTSKFRQGRTRITTPKEDDYIGILSKRNRKLTAPQILAEVNLSRDNKLSLTTVKRRLRAKGLIGRIAVKKPLLSTKNKQKRLNWAKYHQNWQISQWKRVLWSDESKFEIFGSKRRIYVRRRPGEKMIPDCIVPTVKHGGGSVMIWGCFGNNKVGDLVEVKGRMDRFGYLSILKNHALSSGLKLIGRGFTYQHDNDPKHTSKVCKDYLQEQYQRRKVNLMSWPPQSPDLNPIELLWDQLDRELRKTCPTSAKDLLNKLQDAWKNISEDNLNKLLERMPRLCSAVIRAKGGHIDERAV